ncbi:unnamed protein product [Rotaria sp. Silwood1]|nr:unnamed protein product [Rotaria sp. Silwood1]CAF3722108.1 unnamed protein product [Rotaria sp. Silwood1]CAF4594616.1 unnamed protein product [Rotaria sp. Silwood1]CAF4810266.1 unnamed protein product [Rotaria sp. Silwood1]
MIDFIAEPFVATTDNTETLIVVLNELAEELGARLSFTEKAFQYDNSDYRTACGIGNLGSIHSIVGDGGSLQTAHFRLHLNLSYDDLISTAEKFKNFTITLITDIASMIGCKKEFIRVFSVSRASSAHTDIGITTQQLEKTTKLAEQLKHALNNLPKQCRQSILQYLFKENYEYQWKTAINFLELQESDLDSRYNRDYPDAQEEMRGGRPYYFPQGWYRHALKVDDKYSNDHVWLGMSNSPGEWSVAYHGTAAGAVKSIVKGGLKHDFVTTDACKDAAKLQRPSIPDVKGLYVATHCEGGAAEYASNFEIKDSSGTIREYQVVFQCRVENDQFTEHQGPVSIGLALRVFNEKAIRPYGILLKECSSCNVTTIPVCV